MELREKVVGEEYAVHKLRCVRTCLCFTQAYSVLLCIVVARFVFEEHEADDAVGNELTRVASRTPPSAESLSLVAEANRECVYDPTLIWTAGTN
ncbi:hypothetical protein MRX96_004994 [Rhipicephalus microplus]